MIFFSPEISIFSVRPLPGPLILTLDGLLARWRYAKKKLFQGKPKAGLVSVCDVL